MKHNFFIAGTSILAWSLALGVQAPAYATSPVFISDDWLVGNGTLTRSSRILLMPTSDGELFGEGIQTIKESLIPGCVSNMPTQVPMSIRARRVGNTLIAHYKIDMPRIFIRSKCSNGGGGGTTIPLEPIEGDLTLEYRDAYIQVAEIIGLRTTTRLDLACLGGSSVNAEPKIVSNFSVRAESQWDLDLNSELNSDEIAMRKKSTVNDPRNQDSGNAGLTVARLPKFEIDVETSKAKFGGGVCAWVDKVSFTFPEAKIYIASQYAPDKCPYRVTLAHERLHYEDWMQLSKAMLNDLPRLFAATGIPLVSSPVWYVGESEAVDALQGRAWPLLRQRVGEELKLALEGRVRSRDTIAKYKQVYESCEKTDW